MQKKLNGWILAQILSYMQVIKILLKNLQIFILQAGLKILIYRYSKKGTILSFLRHTKAEEDTNVDKILEEDEHKVHNKKIF